MSDYISVMKRGHDYKEPTSFGDMVGETAYGLSSMFIPETPLDILPVGKIGNVVSALSSYSPESEAALFKIHPWDPYDKKLSKSARTVWTENNYKDRISSGEITPARLAELGIYTPDYENFFKHVNTDIDPRKLDTSHLQEEKNRGFFGRLADIFRKKKEELPQSYYDLLDYPEDLPKTLQELFKNTQVHRKVLDEYTGGYYDPNTGNITLNVNEKIQPFDRARSAAHEMAHKQTDYGYKDGKGRWLNNPGTNFDEVIDNAPEHIVKKAIKHYGIKMTDDPVKLKRLLYLHNQGEMIARMEEELRKIGKYKHVNDPTTYRNDPSVLFPKGYEYNPDLVWD